MAQSQACGGRGRPPSRAKKTDAFHGGRLASAAGRIKVGHLDFDIRARLIIPEQENTLYYTHKDVYMTAR